ncbi:hypothetical protein D1F64_12195 [Breoghania sp. L-A4]|nr:hypothetical protein D1F64_12195 [Breoghania sp. L-A4]
MSGAGRNRHKGAVFQHSLAPPAERVTRIGHSHAPFQQRITFPTEDWKNIRRLETFGMNKRYQSRSMVSLSYPLENFFSIKSGGVGVLPFACPEAGSILGKEDLEEISPRTVLGRQRATRAEPPFDRRFVRNFRGRSFGQALGRASAEKLIDRPRLRIAGRCIIFLPDAEILHQQNDLFGAHGLDSVRQQNFDRLQSRFIFPIHINTFPPVILVIPR